MGLFIGFLTVVLALSSAFLVFLILLQLPKKEAGAGVAFGGSTADTLFGAGSGNVLTKLTKYTTTLFLCLCLILTVLQSHYANKTGKDFGEKLKGKEKAAPMQSQPEPQAPVSPANALMQGGGPSNASALTMKTLSTPGTNVLPVQNTNKGAAPAATPAPVTPPATPPAK